MTQDEFSDQIHKFLKDYYWSEILELANDFPEKRSLLVNYTDIWKFNGKLANEFLEAPAMMINDAEEALKEINLPIQNKLEGAHFRIYNVPTKISFRDIRSSHLSRLISVEGMIRKVADTRPRMTKAAFRCLRCGHTTMVEEVSERFEEPFSGCEQETCGKKGPFKVVIDESIFIDSQKLQIQEPSDDLRGTQAQSLEIYAEDDLAGVAWPGERVIITGILKSRQRVLREGKSTYYDILLEAVSIVKLDSAFDELEISLEDEQVIQGIARDPAVYEKCISSIAPAIYGYEDIKEAMVLQLFGGVPKKAPDGSDIRGDTHLMLMGDPSLAKSRLMKACQARCPRALFTSGRSASAGGLTAIVSRDDKWGEGKWTVEAGALVIADKGVLFLDEGDKMRPGDTDALHEAMEQQSISLAKAGILATLPARTSIFMSANPKYGQFDRYEPLADQIAMPPSLLSRFDLIFVLLDEQKPELDSRISEHLLRTHRAGGLLRQKETMYVSAADLEKACEHAVAEISPELFRKYVAYARKTVFPILTTEAMDKIHEFYLSMRRAGASSNKTIPITVRQEEAIIRLSEASARVRLSQEVLPEDVERAIRLIQACLKTIGLNPETGEVDATLWNSGFSKDQRTKIKTLKEILQGRSSHYPDGRVPISDLENAAELHGMKKSSVETYIKKLAERGDVILFGPDHVKLMT